MHAILQRAQFDLQYRSSCRLDIYDKKHGFEHAVPLWGSSMLTV